MPRGLYGRAALILVLPVVVLLLVVSIVFIQRHFDGVTRQMTAGLVLEVDLVLDRIGMAAGAPGSPEAAEIAGALGLVLALDPPAELAARDARLFYDLSGRSLMDVLHQALPGLVGVDLVRDPRRVTLRLATAHGDVAISFARTRVTASNPHQLLVLMVFTSVLMTLIAYLYLRNQLRPIKRLAEAADAFGKGRLLPYSPSGATEVRSAGHAFLDMRARIERQIEQRTLMLSGVSHDLRTPLTRMKLSLNMLPQSHEISALLGDLAEMEAMIEEFLAFARDQSQEEVASVDPVELAEQVAEDARRSGHSVTLTSSRGARAGVPLRVTAIRRALGNLVANAARHGTRTSISVTLDRASLRFRVEDDGPGIPPGQRDLATRPFARLDTARPRDRDGGVGLGLAIARDVAHAHGGTLTLGESATLGGLQVDLVIPR